MQTARVFEYQDNRQFDIDFGYDFVEEPQKQRVKKTKKKSLISERDKGRLLMLTVIAGILCIGIIISTAFCATLQYQINSLTAENTQIEKEIQDVNITLQTKNSLPELEKKAKNKLGMTYPKASQIVYVGTGAKTGDFEATVKEQAYN